jgi:hypothetical protein
MAFLMRGLGVGYGTSGLAGALLFVLCSCALIALAVFWLGGAVAALTAIVALYSRGGRQRAITHPL